MEKKQDEKNKVEKDVEEIGLGKIIGKDEQVMRAEVPKNERLNPNANKEELNQLPSTTKNTM